MRLKKLRVRGFQSFPDTGDLEFSDGFNLVAGQNNSGKSSLLRALRLPLEDDRHRSPQSYKSYMLAVPASHMEIEISGPELKDALLRRGETNFFTLPSGMTDYVAFVSEMLDREKILLKADIRANNGYFTPSEASFLDAGAYSITRPQVSFSAGQVVVSTNSIGNDTLGASLFWIWQNDTFFFNAERFNMGTCAHAHSLRLRPDAANLPAVLQTLRGERGLCSTRS